MNSVKALLSLGVVSVMLSGMAYAEQIGVVDFGLISQKYNKAIELSKQAQTKEQELQALRENLQGQMKAGEKLSPVEKKSLEEKLANDFGTKFKAYRDWAMTQEKQIQTDVDNAINVVRKYQSIDIVLPKQAVVQGGHDITQDVINTLNK